MHGPEADLRRHRLASGRKVKRRVATALQIGFACIDACQHASHDAHVNCLAAVAGAHQRNLVRAEPEPAGAVVLDERQRLQGLERGAREIQGLHIAHPV